MLLHLRNTSFSLLASSVLLIRAFLYRVFDPVAFSQHIKDTASYDPDKDVPDHITRPTGLMGRIPSVGSEVDWMEPSLNIYNSRLVQRCGSNKVYDAFQLLQTEPSVQVSLFQEPVLSY